MFRSCRTRMFALLAGLVLLGGTVQAQQFQCTTSQPVLTVNADRSVTIGSGATCPGVILPTDTVTVVDSAAIKALQHQLQATSDSLAASQLVIGVRDATIVVLNNSIAALQSTINAKNLVITGLQTQLATAQDSIQALEHPALGMTSVVLSPASANLNAGATQVFSTSGKYNDGTTRSVPSNYSSTGGTINAGTYVAGQTAGNFRVIATNGAFADTAAVTVTVQAPVLTSIVLTPATLTLEAATTQAFTTAGIMSNGTTTTVNPTYSATGGTITVGGLYTAGATAGSFRVIASSAGFADTTSVTITVTAPSGSNRPASYTNQSTLDFSQTPPGMGNGNDQPIANSDGWAMYHNSGWTKSAASEWTATFPAGNFSDGHGVGNFFRHMPVAPTRMYLSWRFKYTGPIHPISNKQLNIECSAGSLLLLQLNEGGKWLHQENLVNSGNSFWVDDSPTPGEQHLPGRIGTVTMSPNVFHTVETLIDPPAKVWKVWLDGTLVANATNLPFVCGTMGTPGWNAHRGGGGENQAATATWVFDSVLIAWP